MSKHLQTKAASLLRWLPSFAVLAYGAASCARLAVRLLSGFPRLGEAGYGDTYVFQSVLRFRETGAIYQDAIKNLPSAYGPLLYIVMSIPGRLFSGGNPLLGPRCITAAAFFFSVALVVSTTRALMPHRKLWMWSAPLALSFPAMSSWILQLRGDFIGSALGLLAVRLLLSGTVLTAGAAGVCAGLATQFKFTYVAAFGAGSLWLAMNRRWSHLRVFVIAGVAASAGLYGLFLMREPRLLENVFALRHLIIDFRGACDLVLNASLAPVSLLGLAALPFLSWRAKSGWTLLALFAGASFTIAALTDLQAGANINYFFEAQFASAAMAALAMLKLRRPPYRLAAFCLWGVLLAAVAPDIALDALKSARGASAETAAVNRQFAGLPNAFRNRSVLALVPDAGLLIGKVTLSDPFLASHLERSRMFDLRPLAVDIQSRKFDSVIVYRMARDYRSVPLLSPTLRPAIAEAYEPYCAMRDWVIMTRRGAVAPETFRNRLIGLGCNAAACAHGGACRSW